MHHNKLSVRNLFFLAASPIVTALMLLIFYAISDFYPFGDGTVSWCDMDQQVVPLLLNFKHIFTSSATPLYSFQNAGGMNFWGVFFFFIASPFSFLTLLVKDTQMLLFMNILVLLKLSTCAFTATFYFLRSRRKIRPEFAFLFGIFYAFCGYGLLFYQNIIWLDMMYLFPLLLLSFEHLIYHKKVLPYVITLCAMMVVNYYISYMVILFVILYFGIVSLLFTGAKRKEITLHFLAGSIAAALLTAVIWLPCFLQYLSSGRETSIIESLSNSTFFTSLETSLSILFPSAGTFAILLYGLLHTPLQRNMSRCYLLLFLLLLFPLWAEPINKMWHTGSYQGFPIRYGFMMLFMAMTVSAGFLESSASKKPFAYPSRLYLLIPGLYVLLTLLYGVFTHHYVWSQLATLTHYTRTLWGDIDSLQGLLVLFLLSLFLYLLFYRSLCKRHLSPHIFTLLCLLLFMVDSYANTTVYMLSADYQGHDAAFENAVDLGSFTPEQDTSGKFYRVKLREKYFDVNLVGAMGFPSLSHYTSLTSQDYMFSMKKLGYSSYWMEVGGYGGTLLSDAVFNVAYVIDRNTEAQFASLYANEAYCISETPFCLPLGLATSEGFVDTNELDSLTRLQVQELLFAKLFPDQPSPFVSYDISQTNKCSVSIDKFQQYQLEKDSPSTTGHIYYAVEVKGTQTLYFDCFDRLSNQLSEHINDSFDIYVNGLPIELSYPSKLHNGLISLGTFQDETVLIDVALLQSVTCRSYSVFGMDHDLLSAALSQVQPLDLQATGRQISGQTQTSSAQNIFLSIPYDAGWSLRIDGEKTALSQAFLGFSSFYLPAGTHAVEMVYSPPGFHLGLTISLIGLLLLIAGITLHRLKSPLLLRLASSSPLQTLSHLLTQLLLIGVICAVYLLPVLLNLIHKVL